MKIVRRARWFQDTLLKCLKPSCWVSFLWWWKGRRSCHQGSLPPGSETCENNFKTNTKLIFTVVPLPSNRSSAPSSTADWRQSDGICFDVHSVTSEKGRYQPESTFQSCLLMQVKWLEECLCWPHDLLPPMANYFTNFRDILNNLGCSALPILP